MHAVLRVDLQALGIAALGRIGHELVHAGRAVAGLGTGIFGQVDVHRHAGVFQREVRWLVFGVVGVAHEHAGEAVEGDLAIGLGINDGLALGGGLQIGVVGLVAVQRPWDVALERELLDTVHHRGHGQALLEPGLEVACLVQLGVEPAGLERLGVGREFVVLAPTGDGLIGCLGGQHAGLDGGVAALDAADVEVTRVAAHECTAWEHRFGQAHQATGRDGARAIADALGRLDALGFVAFEVVADVGVRLPALEFLERAEVGVGVVQAGNEAQRDLVVFHVVQEGAAVGVVVHGPAGGVQHEAGLVAGGVNFPQLLDAQAVGLWVAFGIELEAGDDLLAQMATCAFGKDGVFGVQLHAELEVARGLAFLAHTHVAGGHALDAAVVVVEHFCGGKAGENFHAQVLGLLRQPAGHVAQADDVVTVVLKTAWQQEVGRAKRRFLAQEHHGVVGDGLVQRGAEFLPVGNQLGQRLGVHDGARKNVRAGLGAFFEHHHRHILALFGGQLLEPDGGGQAGGAASHHDHVVFHGFAGAVLGEDFLVCHSVSSGV